MSDAERYDGLLMNMAQSQRGIEPLLESVFSFLRRKTDFFSGASPQVVEETVLGVVRKQAALAEKDQYAKKQQEAEKKKAREAKARAKAAAVAKAKEQEQKKKEPEPSPRFEEIKDDEDEIKPEAAPEAMEVETKAAATTDKKEEKEDEEDDGPPLVGNGGHTDRYVWTQTLQEAQVNFAVPEGTRSRQIDVQISANRLKVGLKGQPLMVNGALFKKVKVDDSFWTLEDGNRICVYLQKENQMEWWKTIIEGDAEIDTKKVQPENSQLSDLDADTRQTVEKMMFDQRQKALGLPSSDDMQKQDILQKFMSQHPEMDFSKAKIN